jgi:carboxyl-terminal processing protease
MQYPKFSHLIIDLRFNSGGFVREAIAMLSLFYGSDKPFMEEMNETHNQKRTFLRSRESLFADLHVTVLVNKHSYSAAELFAGVMQDWDRALIIGQPTGGKATVMQKIDLSEGSAFYVAVARYTLPSGRCIQIPYHGDQLADRIPESDDVIYNYVHEYEKPFRCNSHVFYTLNQRPVYSEMVQAL